MLREHSPRAGKKQKQMKKSLNHLAKQCLNLLERELLAVMAVAVVLVFVFSQSQAAPIDQQANTYITTSAIESLSSNEAQGISIFNGKSKINFGYDIKGVNSSMETWTNPRSIANFGTSLMATAPTQVTINGITNGIWRLYITAIGTLTINDTIYQIGSYQTTKGGWVTVANNNLTIKFDTNSQLWEINTTGLDKTSYLDVINSILFTQTPATLNLIPFQYKMHIGSYFSPIPLIQDQNKKIISRSNVSLEWTSTNPNVASVNQNGIVTAIQSGTTIIGAQISGTNLLSSMIVNI